MALKAWSHLSLTVSNLATSSAWYESVLQWQKQGSDRSETTEFAFGQLPGGFPLVLRQHDEPLNDRFDERRPGLDHICFTADSMDDVTSLAERLTASDSTFDAPRELPYGWLLTFRDPDNIALEALFAAS